MTSSCPPPGTSSGPSSNWFKLQKSLVHPRKRRKIDGASSNTIPPPKTRSSDNPSEHADLETTEVKNGESIGALRRIVLGKAEHTASRSTPGKYLAIDCEMVGVGIEGIESSLARVSVVNFTGAVVLDVFVKQREKVVDYRTQWSGVRSTDLAGSARPFQEVQKTVADLIKDRILVGHAIYNDLKALLLSHPSPQIRDTQSLAYKHRVVKSRRPALRVLVQQELGIVIQGGEHSSVTDARAAMALFRLYKKQWESGFRPSHAHARLSSSVSSTTRGGKRKRADADEDANEEDESPSPSSSTRAYSPPPPSASSSGGTTLRTSTLLPGKKSRPPLDLAQRKGISSGISTVIKKAGGTKEVRGKGVRTGKGGEKGRSMGSDSRGKKKSEEKWWKSLGGGKKGSVKV